MSKTYRRKKGERDFDVILKRKISKQKKRKKIIEEKLKIIGK